MKEIELRKRSEDIIKCWSLYLLYLSIGLLGVYWVMPQENKIYPTLGLLVSFTSSIYLMFWYGNYHKKTTELIKDAQ